MTIKNLYPKARPHIIYNVINGRPELPAQASFSRASTGTYVDRSGVIRTAAVDEPRFNYDPDTGEFLGLMLESAGVNSIRESTNFSSSLWLPYEATVTTNAAAAPDGTNTAAKYVYDNNKSGTIKQNVALSQNGQWTSSCFVKKGEWDYAFFWYRDGSGYGFTIELNLVTGENRISGTQLGSVYQNPSYTVTSYPNGWYRIEATAKTLQGSITPRLYASNVPYTVGSYGTPTAAGDGVSGIYTWGWQVNEGLAQSYLPTGSASGSRDADAFSLTTSSDFDNGFSLLLDSNTTTDDFIYKIKAGGSTIAELNNDNGTLDWVIDGTSAATSVPPQYPQIGAIQPGRVRTVSSFGAAGDGDQANYLYTETLSFPTVAEPAAGADELEFGTQQTVKAVYVWDGQLSNTEAVSVIKGEYNVILNEPIQADTYSFVYNTDPTNVGETSITLPYIVPTVSMRVDWGDGTSQRYEQGVTPSHTYPYPGQYRIQIEADDGFDAVRLGDVQNTITRVDQWAPQHRVGATGDGFTGDDMANLLVNQKTLSGTVPSYKYTNLTIVTQAFKAIGKDSEGVVAGPNWNFIPTDLQSATSINSLCNDVNRYATGPIDKTNFPTLTTSSALTNASFAFTYAQISNFVNDRPFTDSSGVTNFQSTFQGTSIDQIILDTSAGTNLSGIFLGTNFVISPNIVTSSADSLASAMSNCSNLTTQLLWDTSSCTNFSSAWKNCSALTSFPLIDTSSGTSFSSAWQDCSALTSFPLIDTSSAQSIGLAWYNCGSLDNIANAGESFSFPLLDFSKVTYALKAFYGCNSFISLPVFDFSLVTNFSYAYFNCSSLTAFPATDLPVCTNFSYSFRGCSGVTVFPSIDMQAGTTFVSAWQYDALLADFPANMFDTTGTLASNAFSNAWQTCALTAQSIENILVSLDTNGQSSIELGIDGGTNAGQSTWSTAANTAYTNLINKGWTITSNP